MQQKNLMLIMLSFSLFLGYLPWYNYSAVLSYISDDFGLTSSDTGFILSAFQLGYVIIVVITGRLADTIGPKKVLVCATFICGCSSVSFALFAQGFMSILILRLLTGLSAGAMYVPGMSLLSGWFQPQERGKAVGAYTGSLSISYAGGYFVASPLAAAYGWQAGILATSVPVFLGAFLIFAFVKECPPETELKFDGKRSFGGPVLITSSYMGHMWELYAFWGWVGPFMTVVVLQAGMDVALGGLLSALIIVLGAPAAYIMGTVADKIGRTKAIVIASTFSLIPQFFFGYMLGLPVAAVVVCGMWIGFWVVADSPIFKAGLTDMISEDIRGTALGIQSALGYSMTIVAPLVFGKVLDMLNPGVSTTEATNWGPCFMILGIGALLAPVMALALRKNGQARLMAGGKM